MSSNIDIDATIIFDSIKHYRELLKSHSSSSISEAISKGHVRTSGLATAIDNFQRKINQYQSSSSSSLGQNDTMGNSSALSVTKFYRMNYNGDLIQPLKHGWLHKKRDIFTGWRPRYIVVYHGRVEYYVNEHDRYPRDVISLLGAEVSLPKKCAVNGEPDHYYIIVEPRGLGASKSLKLASEHVGVNAHAEASTWVKVFQIASKSSDSSSLHHPNQHGSRIPSPNGANSLGITSLPSLDTSNLNPRHPSITMSNPISSARNLFRKRISSFGQDSSSMDASRDSDLDDEYDLWLMMKIALAVAVLVIGGVWYFYGMNGVVISFGCLGMLCLTISVYIFQQMHQPTETKATPILRNHSHSRSNSTADSISQPSNLQPSKPGATNATVVPVSSIQAPLERRSNVKPATATAVPQGSTINNSIATQSQNQSRTTSSNNPSRANSHNPNSSSEITQSDFNGVFKDVAASEQLAPEIVDSNLNSHISPPIDIKPSPSFNVRKFFIGSKDKDKDKDYRHNAEVINALPVETTRSSISPDRRKSSGNTRISPPSHPATSSSLMKEVVSSGSRMDS
jgi:hypothetical protein